MIGLFDQKRMDFDDEHFKFCTKTIPMEQTCFVPVNDGEITLGLKAIIEQVYCQQCEGLFNRSILRCVYH